MSSQEPVERPERWVSVAEAAALLSKSDRTIRRMAADGRLPSKHEGARLWLDVSDKVPAEQGAMSDVSSQDATIASLRAEVDKLEALVGQLTSDVSSQDVTIADLRAELALMAAELDKFEALNRQLTSERDYLRGALASALQVAEHKALEPPRERPWWRFWGSDD